MLISSKFRWAWLVCALLLIGFLTSSISSYLVSKRNVRQTITESSLPLTSDNVYSEIQRDLLRPVFISSLMANDTFLKDWALEGEEDTEAITKYLNQIKIKYSTITSFFVSEKTKKYYHAHGLLKTIDEADERDAWYVRVKEMKEPYEINVDPDEANQDEMTIFINYRVTDYNGQFIGVSGVGLTVNRVNLLISSYEAKYDRHIYFTDTEGNIVLRPSNSPYFGTENIANIEGLIEHLDELISGKKANLTYSNNGNTCMLNCRFVPELKWFLVVEQSEDKMLAPFRVQLLANILIALLVTVIVAWICILTIRRQQSRLEERNEDLLARNEKIAEQKSELQETASQLKAANDELSERNKEKDEFIGIVAHDLRNPLNGILGLCQVTEPQNDEEKSFINAIKNSGERMLSLINTLMEVSRVEGFQGKVETQEVTINHLIKQSKDSFADAANRKNIDLKLELDDSNETSIQTNPDWLEICLNNLLSNAIKYTPEYGKIEIQTILKGNQLEINYTDSGQGISEEEQTRLFRKFERLSSKPTGGESSTGLGLYVVKSMCKRLGIDIKVKSNLGKGSTFSLLIGVENNP